MNRISLLIGSAAILWAAGAAAQTAPAAGNDADTRARVVESQMTPAERTTMTHGIMALPVPHTEIPAGAPFGAGYVPGIPRLGIPALTETDASLGVAYVGGLRKDGATALPSGLAMGATWNPELMEQGGAMIAREAHAKGFNVLLAGGMNLVRDPRGGRDFEYLSEDPLLSGVMAAGAVNGIQSEHVISTVKHFALNAIETGRHFYNAKIGDAAVRMSDLLAFEIAIDRSHPGAVMCAYNRVNGPYACDNDYLLNRVLKTDWGYKGWVMSDWGAVSGLDDALAGLDQQSGAQLDAGVYFGDKLGAAAAQDPRYRARLSDMNRRILRSMFAVGVDKFPPVAKPIDFDADGRVARTVAEQGIVLLRNRDDALPLTASAKRIAVIGGHADAGVLSGGGSSQVEGEGGPALAIPTGSGPLAALMAMSFQRSSPLDAIKARATGADVRFRDGRYITDAVAAAKQADVAIIFATQWMSEGHDVPDIALPEGQDELIAAVAAANPHTIVVLETGGPVAMPWLDKTAAVVEAWYPGARGGQAIASVLFGDVNPSGRLPVTFPASVEQLPRPVLPGSTTVEPNFEGRGAAGQTLDIDFDIEGSDVGYRWFARKQEKPLFPFGFGLSYTSFARSGLAVSGGAAPVATFTLKNTGGRAGADVGQVYLLATPDGAARRLVGFARADLAAGESKQMQVAIDPRVLANWAGTGWEIKPGTYRFALGASADDLGQPVEVRLAARRWK